MPTREQLRAARALINWTQADVARAARISEISVKNIERGVTDPRVATMTAITRALERGGVVFVPENGGGAGVRRFKEHLVGWRQCSVPFPGTIGHIQDAFERAFIAAGAPEDVALFARTSDDRASEIFLLSPAAGRFETALIGRWGAAVNPSLYAWTLLVGSGNPWARLGLRPPRTDEL